MKTTSNIIIGITLMVLITGNTFAKTFSDINSTNPNFTAITYLSEKGIINGYLDGSFKSENNINRAELLKIILEGAKTEISPIQTNCFSDVPYTEWYAPYICTAKSLGYVNGYADNTFKPNQTINKVEAIKMIGKVFDWDITKAKEIELFNDTPLSEWYAPFLQYAKMKNLLQETGTIFNPGENMTRGEVSETLYRLLAIKELAKETFSQETEETIQSELNIQQKQNEDSEANTPEETVTITINGIINDAITGSKIANAEISLYDKSDNFISTTNSDTTGNFTIEETGNLKDSYLIFSKEKYFSLKISPENLQQESHISLSPVFTQINPENLRIVLTWGNTPVDLDAHLLTPNSEEIFFMSRLDQDVNTILDLDDTDANGTETITIRKIETGTYEYFVHNYSKEKKFTTTGARVEIYDKNGLAKIYYPEETEGEIWKVFTLTDNGEITDINQIGSCELLEKTTSICPLIP